MNPGFSIRVVSLDSSSMSHFYLLFFKYFLINTSVALHISADCCFLYIFSHLPLSSLTSQGKHVLCFIDEVTEA